MESFPKKEINFLFPHAEELACWTKTEAEAWMQPAGLARQDGWAQECLCLAARLGDTSDINHSLNHSVILPLPQRIHTRLLHNAADCLVSVWLLNGQEVIGRPASPESLLTAAVHLTINRRINYFSLIGSRPALLTVSLWCDAWWVCPPLHKMAPPASPPNAFFSFFFTSNSNICPSLSCRLQLWCNMSHVLLINT